MPDDQPSILVIAHDNDCSICGGRRCNCVAERILLVGEMTLPSDEQRLRLAHYAQRLNKLMLVLDRQEKKQ